MKTHSLIKKQIRVNDFEPEKIHEVVENIRKEPGLGASKFRLSNRWLGGDSNRSVVEGFRAAGQEQKHKKTFVFENGEPPVLLGKDEGANPVEFLLHALAGCVTTTTVMHAAARKIPVQRLETSLEGDLDVRGLLGISDDVAKGYQQIRVTMKIVSDAKGEEREALKNFYRLSPVLNTIGSPVDVEVHIEKA